MTAVKKVTFRLKDGKKPVSWQLPMANVFRPKQTLGTDPAKFEDRLIHYLPGASSIWVEDYKGDKKDTPEIVFEDGELDVSPTNTLLLQVLRIHPWFNVHYVEVNEDAEASADVEKYSKIKEASNLVDDEDPLKVKAIAFAIIGLQAEQYSDEKCKAELQKLVHNGGAQEIIDEFRKPNYETKLLVSLALVKKLLYLGNGGTSVNWTDNDGIIIRIAVGENPIDKMADFLSSNLDGAKATLQRIGELTSQKTTVDPKEVVINSDSAAAKIIQDQSKEIEELKQKLEQLKTNTTGADNQDNVDKKEDVTDSEKEKEDKPVTVEEVRAEFLAIIGKEVHNAKKNDILWMLGEIETAKKAKQQ